MIKEKIDITRKEWEKVLLDISEVKIMLSNHIHHLNNHIKFIYWFLPLLVTILSIAAGVVFR